MVLLMVLYPLSRWPIEMLRADEPALFAGMTLSQLISLGLFLSGIATGVWLSRRPRGRLAGSVRDRPGASNAATASA
jgi:phosphatidylglycerol:prolipoprotein diacylglycerol transferase